MACLAAVLSAQVGQPQARVAVTVTPDRADWTYELGAPVRFRNGRLLLPVATADSWYWYAGVLDLRTGQVQKFTLDYFTDFRAATWATDGSIIGSALDYQSTLWKFAPSVK